MSNSNQPTRAEVARQLEEARAEIHNLENFVLIETQAHQNWMVRAQKAEAEIERLKAALVQLYDILSQPHDYNVLTFPTVTGGNGGTAYKGDLVISQAKGYVKDVLRKAPGEKGGEG